MILVDAGPLVAIFRRSESQHAASSATLKSLRDPLVTLLPVLAEAFYLLSPSSDPANRLRAFIREGAAAIHLPGAEELERAFTLMEEYAGLPADFADASLIAAAETLGTLKIFTLDKRDFAVYRIRKGKRRMPVAMV